MYSALNRRLKRAFNDQIPPHNFFTVDHLSISSSEDRVDSVVGHPVGLSTRRERMKAVLQQLTISRSTASADQDGAEDDDEDDDNDAAAKHQKC